eukprot:gb/GECH01012983.1/.p1 GENE.gb/GECH01012983.1/~~gb/GECH01012983.1/.p1  ORF type:complete len:1803 (+),score=413.66 gb/GECH01012983.1/:1-5409(+)
MGSLNRPEPEEKYTSISKYKHFRDEINSALANFEKAKHWSDLNICLDRFNKILQTSKYSKYPILPEKYTVCKRLCQCLSPSHPIGIHKKALNTYENIFEHIGLSRLGADLPIFAAGLFSFFGSSSMQIKPNVLEIIKRYFLPLKETLIPSLPGIILGLLPGLEEQQGSTIYDEVFEILVMIRDTTNVRIFYHTLWKIILSAPQGRIPACNLIGAILSKGDISELSETFGGDRELVVNAIVASVKDSSTMTERAVLDLLSTHYKIDTELFTQSEIVKILSELLHLLKKDELPLSRRIFSWILGPEEDEHYFEQYCQEPLIEAIQEMLIRDRSNPSEKGLSLIFIVVKSLMDDLTEKQIDYILRTIMADIIQSLVVYNAYSFGDRIIDEFLELTPQISRIAWESLVSLVREEKTKHYDVSHTRDMFELVRSAQEIIPSNESDAQKTYIPKLLLGFLEYLEKNVSNSSLTIDVISEIVLLCMTSLGKVEGLDDHQIIRSFQDTYSNFFYYFLENYILEASDEMSQDSEIPKNQVFQRSAAFLMNILGLSSNSLNNEPPSYFSELVRCYKEVEDDNVSLLAIQTIVELLTHPCSPLPKKFKNNFLVAKNIQPMIIKLWDLLEPRSSGLHYDVVKLLEGIHKLRSTICNGVISDLMVNADINRSIHGLQKFSLVWKLAGEMEVNDEMFTSGLFHMLDSIQHENATLKHLGRSWLTHALTSIHRVVDPLLMTLIDYEAMGGYSKPQASSRNMFIDKRRTDYVLKTWVSMLNVTPKRFIREALQAPVSSNILSSKCRYLFRALEARTSQQSSTEDSSPATSRTSSMDSQAPLTVTIGRDDPSSNRSKLNMEITDYYSLLLASSLKLLEYAKEEDMNNVQSNENEDTSMKIYDVINSSIKANGLQVIHYLIAQGSVSAYGRDASSLSGISQTFLSFMEDAIVIGDAVVQNELLEIISVMLRQLNQSPSSPVEAMVHSPKFLPVLLKGIGHAARAQHSAALQSFSLLENWVYYLGSYLPFLDSALPSLVSTLLPTLCEVIRENVSLGINNTTMESIMICIHGIQRIINLCLLHYQPVADSPKSAGSEGRGTMKFLTDFVKDVFTVEAEDDDIQVSSEDQAHQFTLSELPSIIESIVIVWQGMQSPNNVNAVSSISGSALTIGHRTPFRTASINLLESIWKKYPSQLMSSFIILWARLHPFTPYSLFVETSPADKFIMDVITSMDFVSARQFISMFAEIVPRIRENNRPIQQSKRGSKSETELLSGSINETIAIHFITTYLEKSMEIEQYGSILPILSNVIRDAVTPSIFSRTLYIGMINSTIKRMENFDKREHKELMDVMSKNIESCVISAAKEPFMNEDLISDSNEILEHIQTRLPKSEFPNLTANDRGAQILNYLADVIPSLFHRLCENNLKEQVAMLNSCVLVPPLFQLLRRGHSRESLSRLHAGVKLLSLLPKEVFTLKTLRKDLWDMFLENNFFKVDFNTLCCWKVIFKNLMKDKSLFSDLLTKISASQPLAFLSRESEAVSRARLLKRMAFLIYCSRFDGYIRHVAGIQEKLVDCIKTSTPSNTRASSQDLTQVSSLNAVTPFTTVFRQVLFCFRILITRISSSSLTTLWPIVVSEMLRVLDTASLQTPDVLLETMNFIDFATVVSPGEFQIYKWAFVGEDVDFNSLNEEQRDRCFFQPLLEQFSVLPNGGGSHATLVEEDSEGRRPMIHKQPKSLEGLAAVAQTLSSKQRAKFLSKMTSSKDAHDNEFIDQVLAYDFIEGNKSAETDAWERVEHDRRNSRHSSSMPNLSSDNNNNELIDLGNDQ